MPNKKLCVLISKVIGAGFLFTVILFSFDLLDGSKVMNPYEFIFIMAAAMLIAIPLIANIRSRRLSVLFLLSYTLVIILFLYFHLIETRHGEYLVFPYFAYLGYIIGRKHKRRS